MNKIAASLVSTAVLTVSLALSTIAHAKKPKVCEAWAPYTLASPSNEQAPKAVYVCFDGKKPYLMVAPKFVELPDGEGNVMRVAVGN